MKGKGHILCTGCGDQRKIASGDCQEGGSRVIYIPALRQGRTGTGGKADRLRAGKGLRKKSLTAPRRSGKVLPRAERRQGGRRKAAGATPQAGTLRTGYWTDGITLNYQLASEASAGRTLRSWLPRIYNFFFFFMSRSRDARIPLFFNGEFDPGSG